MKIHNPWMIIAVFLALGAMLMSLGGCASHKAAPAQAIEPQPQPVAQTAPAPPPLPVQTQAVPYRPKVEWQPSFKVSDVKFQEKEDTLPKMRVGASIKARNGNVMLRDVIKGMAELKGMTVSWGSDVDQTANVDVNINAEDDFWVALTNLLKQLDYFFEFENNTIFIKYKETRRYYLPVPFISSQYKTSVGGNLLGTGEAAAAMKGTVAINSKDNKIDLWGTIESNLSKILRLGTTQVPISRSATGTDVELERRIQDECRSQFPARPSMQLICQERARAAARAAQPQPQAVAAPAAQSSNATAEAAGLREGFYYTIDRPLGIITVTAPRSLLEQVETYIETVKQELARQVIIEAKIIEVRLDENNQRGIDWSDLLKDSQFDSSISFGNLGQIYPEEGIKLISNVNLFTKSFKTFLNAMKDYGDVRVLSNPKLSLINGQPAMLTVGQSIRYIDRVTSTIDSDTGIITYSVDTKSILSGIGFSVYANISSDDEVVLHLTPVTSKLQEPIEYRQIGGTADSAPAEVGLPRVDLREVTTMATVKSGQILIIGGLIDEVKGNEGNKVPVLGDIPLVGNAFKNDKKYSNKRELIILLKPEVVHL